jgi:hypothetical protein
VIDPGEPRDYGHAPFIAAAGLRLELRDTSAAAARSSASESREDGARTL